ncbi:MAG TPA: SPOR domain-containing protein [Rhizomicrobium sp.]
MRRYWHIGFLVLIMVSAAAMAAPDALQAARAALQSGNAVSAEKLAGAALDAGGIDDHDRAALLLIRGLARQRLGNRDDALVDMTMALETHAFNAAETAQASYDRGALLDEMGRTEDAVGDYTAAVDLSPGFAPAVQARAADQRRQAPTQPDPVKTGPVQAAASADAPIILHPPRQGEAPIVLHLPQRIALHLPQHTNRRLRLAVETPGLRAEISDGLPDPSSGAQVQLGAWRSESDATQAWSHILGLSGQTLDGLSPHVIAADIPGKGRYFRLRAGPVTKQAAIAVCAALRSRHLACMLARN